MGRLEGVVVAVPGVLTGMLLLLLLLTCRLWVLVLQLRAGV